jgi:hypothetical protein
VRKKVVTAYKMWFLLLVWNPILMKSVYLFRFNSIAAGVVLFLWISASTDIGKYLALVLV